MSEFSPVTAAGVRAAAERLHGVVRRTPLLRSDALDALVGGRVYLKAEALQYGGSFKLRGAWNRLVQLSAAEQRRGVLAWSSGNHALGVAIAARRLDMPAVIVMPKDAPAVKADQVRALGAEIVPYDRYTEDREAIGRRLAAERGLALAPSYDHPHIIEGQGTIALETVADAGEPIDAFVICCGGGGLAAGCATILEEVSPTTDVILAEPEFYAETWASIATQRRHFNDVTVKTLCDALATRTPGELTLPILARRAAGGAAASDAEVAAAIRFAFKHLKLVLEPGGAAALAVILAGKVDCEGRAVAVTLSGGNIDAALFARLLTEH